MGCHSSKELHDTGKNDREPQLLDKYVVGEKLGEGSFGIVFSCRLHDQKSDDYAVKMVDKVETPEEKIMQEVNYQRRMEHPNVLTCSDVFHEKCFVCLVSERLRGGDLITALSHHWRNKGAVPLEATIRMLRQIGLSLKYLHDQFLVHRDIKGDNYLCDRPEVEDQHIRIVLTDFGTTCDCPPGRRLNEMCGTKIYWAPEVYRRDYSMPVDLFAAGVIFYGMVYGGFPFANEREVLKKVVKLNQCMPDDCNDAVAATLDKSEATRITAEGLMAHEFLQHKTEDYTYDSRLAAFAIGDIVNMAESGANHCVHERRQELVERLQDAHLRLAASSSGASGNFIHAKDRFKIRQGRGEATVIYEWWDAAKVGKQIDLSVFAGKHSKADVFGSHEVNVDELENMLKDHGVDITKFGLGLAKTMYELVDEIRSGAAVMMLDASAHKKAVRVVNVVCLRIRAPQGSNKILIETGQEFVDGRKRNVARLPASKKQPHENFRQVAERILRDELASFGKMKVKFDWNRREVYEEEEDSQSFPGLRTVYKKEIVPGMLIQSVGSSTSRKKDTRNSYNSSSRSSGRLQRPSLAMRQDRGSVVVSNRGSVLFDSADVLEREITNRNKKIFKWITEKECLQMDIKFSAPEDGMAVSSLVLAPLGMHMDALKAKLLSQHVDISRFGEDQAKSLADLANELVDGECTLSTDEKGDLIRHVNMVVVKMCRPDGCMLVEVERVEENGKVTQLKRLPGAKLRPDENLFLGVQRMLRRRLKVDEEYVMIDNQKIEIIEERMLSAAYPSLPTVYHRRIVTATLTPSVNALIDADEDIDVHGFSPSLSAKVNEELAESIAKLDDVYTPLVYAGRSDSILRC